MLPMVARNTGLEENLRTITKHLAVAVLHIYQVLKIYNNFEQQYCVVLMKNIHFDFTGHMSAHDFMQEE